MKIIALHHEDRRGTVGAVVELSYHELSEIIGPTASRALDRAYPGQVIPIYEQYKHAMKVVERIGEASRLPEQLRTLASMLELSHPALANIVEPEAAEPPSA